MYTYAQRILSESHVRSIETEESGGRERGNDLVNRAEECRGGITRFESVASPREKEKKETYAPPFLLSPHAWNAIDRTKPLKRALCEP